MQLREKLFFDLAYVGCCINTLETMNLLELNHAWKTLNDAGMNWDTGDIDRSKLPFWIEDFVFPI